MWPNQLAFHFLISCRIFLCYLTLSNTSSFLTWTVYPSPAPHFKAFQAFLIYCPKRPKLQQCFLKHLQRCVVTILVFLALVFQNHTSAQCSSGAQWRSGSLVCNDLFNFQLTENSPKDTTSSKHWQGAQDKRRKLNGTVILESFGSISLCIDKIYISVMTV
jgi:hypothetical protein